MQVRYAFLAGLAVVILLVPVNRWLAAKIEGASERMMAHKDGRLQIMGELLRGIHQVKLSAWEPRFITKVTMFMCTALCPSCMSDYVFLSRHYDRCFWLSACSYIAAALYLVHKAFLHVWSMLALVQVAVPVPDFSIHEFDLACACVDNACATSDDTAIAVLQFQGLGFFLHVLLNCRPPQDAVMLIQKPHCKGSSCFVCLAARDAVSLLLFHAVLLVFDKKLKPLAMHR